jgi:hypothetical protein
VTKRAKIIIGVLIAILLGGGIAAGVFASSGVAPAKSSNQIKTDIEKAFEGKDYFESVDVQSYSGIAKEENLDKAADSAGITLSLNKLDEATFKDAAATMPELKMTAFYRMSNSEDAMEATSVTGFKYEDFKNEATVNDIARSLKVRETYDGSFWQISRGDAEGNDATKMKTQFVTKETKVAEIRKTVNAVLSPKMDVLPVLKTELSAGSFTQIAAVDGKMTNYDKALEIGLKFADAAFLDGEKVVLLGLGDDMQISYTSLRKGLDKAKLTEISKELNKDQLFKINVVSPEDTATPTESAKPSESASPSAEATPSPSQSAK